MNQLTSQARRQAQNFNPKLTATGLKRGIAADAGPREWSGEEPSPMWRRSLIIVLALLAQPALGLAQTRSPIPDPMMPDPCRIAPSLPFCD